MSSVDPRKVIWHHNQINEKAVRHYGYGMQYGPALFIIGMSAVGAIVSVFMPKSDSA